MSDKGPEDRIFDGNIKATIWKNDSENGSYFSTTFSRLYEDDKGNVKEAHSFSGTDMLKVGELARKAYHRSRELGREYRRDAERSTSRAGTSGDFDRSRRSAPRARR